MTPQSPILSLSLSPPIPIHTLSTLSFPHRGDVQLSFQLSPLGFHFPLLLLPNPDESLGAIQVLGDSATLRFASIFSLAGFRNPFHCSDIPALIRGKELNKQTMSAQYIHGGICSDLFSLFPCLYIFIRLIFNTDPVLHVPHGLGSAQRIGIMIPLSRVPSLVLTIVLVHQHVPVPRLAIFHVQHHLVRILERPQLHPRLDLLVRR